MLGKLKGIIYTMNGNNNIFKMYHRPPRYSGGTAESFETTPSNPVAKEREVQINFVLLSSVSMYYPCFLRLRHQSQ